MQVAQARSQDRPRLAVHAFCQHTTGMQQQQRLERLRSVIALMAWMARVVHAHQQTSPGRGVEHELRDLHAPRLMRGTPAVISHSMRGTHGIHDPRLAAAPRQAAVRPLRHLLPQHRKSGALGPRNRRVRVLVHRQAPQLRGEQHIILSQRVIRQPHQSLGRSGPTHIVLVIMRPPSMDVVGAVGACSSQLGARGIGIAAIPVRPQPSALHLGRLRDGCGVRDGAAGKTR